MDEKVSMRKDAEQIVIKNINAANSGSDRDDGERMGGDGAVCSPAGMPGREQEAMRDVLDLAMNMGRVLLKNGAEIFRVEETIEHVCRRFHIKDVESFVMSNGIFMTARDETQEVYAKVKHIPISGFHLGIVTEVNDLSREISAGKVGLEEAKERLCRIEAMPPKRGRFRVFAAGIGSGCFCYLLQANLWESMLAVVIGCLLYIFVIFAENHRLSKIIIHIVGGGLITIMALFALQMPWPFPVRIDKLIIGSILPLVPGLAFVNLSGILQTAILSQGS